MAKKIILFRPSVKRHIYAFSPSRGAYFKESTPDEDFSPELQPKIMGIPISLLYVAAPLVAKGYEVKIIDECVDPEYHRHLEQDLQDAVCVGISIVAAGYPIKSSLIFAQRVKQLASIPVIWGGYHISALPQQSLADDRVDIAVFGEGEATMLEIVQALEQGRSLEGIKGCCYKQDGRLICNPPRELVDLDALPPLPYHLLDIEKYIERRIKMRFIDYFVLFTSRGCPHNCQFCATCYVYNHNWRGHKIDTVIETLKFFVTHYHIRTFDFRDDNFFCRKSRVKEFCEALIKADLNIKWAATCRVDYLTAYEPEFFQLLKQSGLVYLHVGVEHGSDKMLEALGKGYDTAKAFEGLQKNEDWGKIVVMCSWQIGFPMETREDVYATLKFIARLFKFNTVSTHSLHPYFSFPGSSMYDMMKSQGHPLPDSLEAWSDIDNMPLKIPKAHGKFYIALINFNQKFSDLLLKGNPRIKAWLAFRLWLVCNLRWEWTLYATPDFAIIRYFMGLKSRLKKKVAAMILTLLTNLSVLTLAQDLLPYCD